MIRTALAGSLAVALSAMPVQAAPCAKSPFKDNANVTGSARIFVRNSTGEPGWHGTGEDGYVEIPTGSFKRMRKVTFGDKKEKTYALDVALKDEARPDSDSFTCTFTIEAWNWGKEFQIKDYACTHSDGAALRDSVVTIDCDRNWSWSKNRMTFKMRLE